MAWKLKNIRNKFGLSQRDFGKRLGVTHAYISRIESGKENPSETLLKLLSYEFGTDGTDIMSNSKLKLLYEKLDMAMSNTELAMNYMKQCISLLENHVK